MVAVDPVALPPEVTAGFVAEARSYLPALAASLAQPGNSELLDEAYRFAHTIKSSAAMLGLESLSQLAELLEGDLEGFQLGEPALPAHLAQMGRSVVRIERLLGAAAGEAVDLDAIVAAEVADRTALLSRDTHLDTATATLREEPHSDEPQVLAAVPEAPAAASDEPCEAPIEVPAAFLDAVERSATPSTQAASTETRAQGEIDRVSAGNRPAARSAPPAGEDAPSCDPSQAGGDSAVVTPVPDALLASVSPLPAAQPLSAEQSSPGAQSVSTEQSAPAERPVSVEQSALAASPALGEPAAFVEPPHRLASLVDTLAEAVLALGRDLAVGQEDVQEHIHALIGQVQALGSAAGMAGAALQPAVEAPSAAAPEAADHATPPGGETVRRAATAVVLPESGTALAAVDPPALPANESTGAVVELDPETGSEAALRRTLEAELRFQIEEEVRSRVAREAPRTLPATGVRVGAAMPAGAFAPAPSGSTAADTPTVSGSGSANAEDAVDLEIDDETREVFALEAAEHLKRIDDETARLAADPASQEARAALRRAVHTLKGAAAMLGFQPIASLAHSLEDRLDQPGAGLDLPALLQDLEQLQALVRAVLTRPAAGVAAAASLAPAVTGAQPEHPTLAGQAPVDAGPMAVPVRLDHLDDLLRVAGELSVAGGAWPALLSGAGIALAGLRHGVERLRALATELDEQRFATSSVSGAGQSPVVTRMASQAGFDPLELDRYTQTDLLAHELAEIAATAHSAERELASVVESAGDLVTAQRRHAADLQSRLLDARLVPLQDLASRLALAARGVAARREKQVALTFTGADVAVDRAILDSVADALLHLVRNASDHGVEPPAERRRRGKPEAGTVRVAARQERGEVVIEVSDDGRGIDPRSMGAAARAAGLDPETLSVAQAVELIFRPGVSTAGVVDDVSGRGVGLDAVRAAIERVRGTIDVLTQPGLGTTFVLRFPVTLAQARVVMAEVAGNPIAIPAGAVQRVARLGDLDVESGPDGQTVQHAGQSHPLLDLAALLAVPRDRRLPTNPPVLLVESAGARAALVADAAAAQQDVVIKPLGAHLVRARAVAGATLLQDGRVGVLLHLPDLLAGARSVHGYRTAPLMAEGGSSLMPDTSTALRVLVVDDSPTIRKLLVRMLKDLGWHPAEARDGAEALEMIRVSPPDAVLADIEMPGLDGYGLLAALRAQAATASLPVVMLTSRTAERHRARAAELGASGYLTKPYRPEDVVAALRGLCRLPSAA